MLGDRIRDLYKSQQKSRTFKSESMDSESWNSINASNDQILESVATESAKPTLHEELVIQRDIRPYFGKQDVNRSTIGTPPDFVMLSESDGRMIKHYACTLFFDIKGSTRLSLLYELEDVVAIKNTVIKTCIEVIRSLDGHVHRLMGDAVMAFFGSKHTCEEDAIADALNCCVTLKAVIENGIKPWLEDEIGIDDLGFRIGCDFGKNEDVIWTNYGFNSVGEVTATGLSVDMASKLQNLSKKNHVMLGQGLIEQIDWPDELSKIKESNEGPQTHVKPNITRRDGTRLDYKMRLLNYDKFLMFSALPIHYRKNISGRVTSQKEMSFFCSLDPNGSEIYHSASKFLEKNTDLFFFLKAPSKRDISYPLKVKLTKVNHGKEAREAKEEGRYPQNECSLNFENANRVGSDYFFFVRKEGTLYKGLHTMECTVHDAYGTKVLSDTIGVLIK